VAFGEIRKGYFESGIKEGENWQKNDGL